MKRYVNAQYENPRTRGQTVQGNELWLKATVKRGSRPQPPTVVWFANRTDLALDDGSYVPDPTFNVPGGQDAGNQRWACVTVPQVTGLEWTFGVRRSKVGKPEKTIAIADSIRTWKRFFLNVDAKDEGLYALFRAALPTIQRAYDPAFIEIVENRVQIDGVDKRGKSTDKSRHGTRVLGNVFKVNMAHPGDDSFTKDITVKFRGGQPRCGPAYVLNGTDLIITLGEGAWWDDAEFVKGVAVTVGAQEVLKVTHWGDVDDLKYQRPLAAAAVGLVAERTSDRVLTIHLAAPPMTNKWDAPSSSWTAARAPTVMQAIGAGDVDLVVQASWTVHGGTGGQQVGSSPVFNTWIDEGADKLAAVLSHELAHACGLVRQHNVQKYVAARNRFESNAAARVAGATQVLNADYYDASYGGSGTHCKKGSRVADSCITRNGQTYVYDTGAHCIMFHASLNMAAGVKFCSSCIQQLRGR